MQKRTLGQGPEVSASGWASWDSATATDPASAKDLGYTDVDLTEDELIQIERQLATITTDGNPTNEVVARLRQMN